MRRIVQVVLVTSVILPVAAAEGATRTFVLDGTITAVSVFGSPGFPTSAAVGDHVAYSFTFDTDAADTNPSPSIGDYIGIASQTTIKDETFVGQAPLISIRDNSSFPSLPGVFHVESKLIVAGPPLFSSAVAFFNLIDQDGSVLTGPSLPDEPYDPTSFAFTSFTIKFYAADGSVNYDGIIVPEPFSIALLLAGFAALATRR